MMKPVILLIFALLALLFSTATANIGNSRFHSAKCLAMRRKCGPYIQKESGTCRAGKFARNQSRACHESACAWCRIPGKSNIYPCNAKNVRAICKAVAAGRRVKPYIPGRRPSRPSTRAPATRRPIGHGVAPKSGTAAKSGCVYSGSNRVVVDLGKAPMGSRWTRTSRGGMTGVVYEKNGGGGIDSQKDATTMCYKMRVSVPGDYLVTAVSAAPHSTEHNDMWISSSLGFKLLRHGKFRSARPGQFLKAYQNKGGFRLADYLSTVDHKGHAFIIPNMQPGKILKYCMSGRSTKYEVYKLIIVKCGGRMCLEGRPPHDSLIRAAPSRCS